MNRLRKSSCASLQQVQQILTEIAQKQIEYTQEFYINAGIGRHVRHILDHYVALQNGLISGKIDYNKRSRNSVIETNLFSASEKVQQLIQWITDLDDTNNGLFVYSEIDCEESISQEFSSNRDREFLYLINHTIHHAAYIKLLLQQFNIKLPEHIGIAPCTATQLRQQALVY